ncbi:hypothetical protein GTZ97_02380 [Aquabacterium fontiphilum]|nr:hypothetical protein [Aquabacterium fontiphilum]
MKTPGFGECLQLCDVGELEHVCDLIPEAFTAARCGNGEAYGLHLSLRKNLHAPVLRYVEELERWQDATSNRRRQALEKLSGQPVRIARSERMEMQPSLDFLEQIERIADRIEFGPWSPEDAEDCAARLRHAWYRWIAYLSSYWMWARVPRILAGQKLSQANGKKAARDGTPGRTRLLDHDAIYKKLCELQSTHGRAAAGIVARIFGCTARYVREIEAREKRKKSGTNPAG